MKPRMKRYLTDIGKLVGKDNVMFFLVLLNLPTILTLMALVLALLLL